MTTTTTTTTTLYSTELQNALPTLSECYQLQASRDGYNAQITRIEKALKALDKNTDLSKAAKTAAKKDYNQQFEELTAARDEIQIKMSNMVFTPHIQQGINNRIKIQVYKDVLGIEGLKMLSFFDNKDDLLKLYNVVMDYTILTLKVSREENGQKSRTAVTKHLYEWIKTALNDFMKAAFRIEKCEVESSTVTFNGQYIDMLLDSIMKGYTLKESKKQGLHFNQSLIKVTQFEYILNQIVYGRLNNVEYKHKDVTSVVK